MRQYSQVSRRLACLAVVWILSVSGAQAAVEVFLKVDGITGDTTDSRHPGETKIVSWSWGFSKISKPTPRPPDFNSISLTLFRDRATADLMKACAAGTIFDRAVLTLRTGDDRAVEFCRIILEKVAVSSFTAASSQGDEDLVESMALDFARVGVEHFTILAGGNAGDRTAFSWNIPTGTAGGVTFPGTSTDYYKDTDGDGMPDFWEAQFGLDPNKNDAALDKDGDGATNFEEYIAGSNPTDKNQVFRSRLTFTAGATTATLSWNSAPGIAYRIHSSNAIGEAFSVYDTVTGGAGSSTSVQVPLSLVTKFFKIEALGLPQ